MARERISILATASVSRRYQADDGRWRGQAHGSDGATTLQARTRHREVTDEGDCGDGSGCGNGRDEVDGAARAAGGDKRRSCSDSRNGTLVTVTGPTEARPFGGLTIDFVVVPEQKPKEEI